MSFWGRAGARRLGRAFGAGDRHGVEMAVANSTAGPLERGGRSPRIGRMEMTDHRGGLACGLVLCGPEQLEANLAAIRDAGYAGVELHPPHLDAYAAGPDAGARAAEAIAAAGLRIACANVNVLRDAEYPDTTFRRLDAAIALGAPMVFALMGNARGGTWAEQLGRFRALCDRAAAHGVRVVLHHHAGTPVTGAETIARFLDEVDRDNAGLLFDTAHWALYETDLAGAPHRLAGRIDYVHAKDLAAPGAELMAGRAGDTLEGVRDLVPSYADVGAGVLDLAGFARGLAASGFAGWTTIEMETLRHETFAAQAAHNAAAWRALTTAEAPA